MNVREFLLQTDVPFAEIAKDVGVHVSRIYDWRDGRANPGGIQLARLMLLSAGAITAESVAETPGAKGAA